MKYPKIITITVKKKITTSVWDAFYDGLMDISDGIQYSKQARSIAADVMGILENDANEKDVCRKAYELVMDAPTVYKEEILENLPPELCEVLNNCFQGV